MKRINSAAITGFVLCFAAIVFGIATNGGVKSIFNLLHIPSAIVTFGGAICAVMMTTDSFEDFTGGLRSFVRAFRKQEMSVYTYGERFWSYPMWQDGKGCCLWSMRRQELRMNF